MGIPLTLDIRAGSCKRAFPKRNGHVRTGYICALGLLWAASAWAESPRFITRCPRDSVLVGQLCVDRYEASVWQIPSTNSLGLSNTWLIHRIEHGFATLADLTLGNAILISPASVSTCAQAEPGTTCSSCDAPAFPATFPENGQWTQPLYAVSVGGVQPTGCISWFQAAQACRLAGKRLLTNLEWQDAVAGTPDTSGGNDNLTTDCNVNSGHAVSTGSRAACRSSWGAFDMVGNLDEWVAEWLPASTGCPGWGSFSGEDSMCLSGASETVLGPGALTRGGSFSSGAGAGVFAVSAQNVPYTTAGSLGFRCVR